MKHGNPTKYKIIAILMCASAPLVSNVGFSNLVGFLYPIFGFLGIIQILILLKREAKKSKTIEKKT